MVRVEENVRRARGEDEEEEHPFDLRWWLHVEELELRVDERDGRDAHEGQGYSN